MKIMNKLLKYYEYRNFYPLLDDTVLDDKDDSLWLLCKVVDQAKIASQAFQH